MPRSLLAGAALVLLAASLLPPATAAQADPAAVFERFLDARNRGDVTAATSLFTEDAVFRGGQCSPCIGRAAIEAEIERRVAEGQLTTAIRSESGGDSAAVLIEFTTAAQRSAGAQSNVSVATLWTRDGRLSFVSIVAAARVAAVLNP